MRTLKIALIMSTLAALTACDDSPTRANNSVSIDITQSLTGQTTSAGTFRMTGALADNGTTQEELVFGGPLTTSPVPLTFTRVLSSSGGTITLHGSASLAFTSQTEAKLTGSWTVVSGTGRYVTASGNGTMTGSANFGSTPPGANITYVGLLTGTR